MTPLTLTHVGLRIEAEAFLAVTGEAARGISAQAVITQQPVDSALVDVCEMKQKAPLITRDAINGQETGAGKVI